MRINGTLINYYFHCKRQCYLHGNRLNLEDNSEQVKIGKAKTIHCVFAKMDEMYIYLLKIQKRYIVVTK